MATEPVKVVRAAHPHGCPVGARHLGFGQRVKQGLGRIVRGFRLGMATEHLKVGRAVHPYGRPVGAHRVRVGQRVKKDLGRIVQGFRGDVMGPL